MKKTEVKKYSFKSTFDKETWKWRTTYRGCVIEIMKEKDAENSWILSIRDSRWIIFIWTKVSKTHNSLFNFAKTKVNQVKKQEGVWG